MTDFKFNCPHCKQSLEAPEEMLGQQINCPSCNGAIKLPNPQPKKPTVVPSQPTKQTKACPFCGEEILSTAVKCKHCGEFLDPKAAPRPTAPAAPLRKPDLAKGEFECANCHYIGLPTKKAKANMLLTILLLCLGGIPGLIYMVAYSGYKFLCPKCGYNFKTDVLR